MRARPFGEKKKSNHHRQNEAGGVVLVVGEVGGAGKGDAGELRIQADAIKTLVISVEEVEEEGGEAEVEEMKRVPRAKTAHLQMAMRKLEQRARRGSVQWSPMVAPMLVYGEWKLLQSYKLPKRLKSRRVKLPLLLCHHNVARINIPNVFHPPC